ncbi:4262_t:CDS:2 [Gigaspora margarita]|uniref:4262_t:CDS:1 n=1 Tax=Gigaspora margarita TaxID=4874 RepID=A0ABN7UHH3_GIGMA|nr:4262_t:CDS:2 [Gigaspora margarita]
MWTKNNLQLVLTSRAKNHYGEEEYNEEIEYDSDVYNTMDDDNLIQINKIDKDLDQEFPAISMNELDYIQSNKKQLIYIILADKALKGAFNDALIFTSFCEVMRYAIEWKMKNKSNKNLKYSEEFTNFLVILGGISSRPLDIFHQNLEAKFKRLIDTINYNRPIAAMMDNTKLKLGL